MLETRDVKLHVPVERADRLIDKRAMTIAVLFKEGEDVGMSVEKVQDETIGADSVNGDTVADAEAA